MKNNQKKEELLALCKKFFVEIKNLNTIELEEFYVQSRDKNYKYIFDFLGIVNDKYRKTKDSVNNAIINFCKNFTLLQIKLAKKEFDDVIKLIKRCKLKY